MEPLNNDELNQLLRRWEAPEPPAGLGAGLPGRSRWNWLLRGSIRVPVPLLAAAMLLLVVFSVVSRLRVPTPADTINFAEFQPVEELEPRILRGGYETR